MSNLTLFVSLERLKSPEFGFDTNTEQHYIIPSLLKGQKFLIKPILGDDFYNLLIKYVDDLKAGLIPANSEYDMLIDDYIAPALAYYVKSELLYQTMYKMKNNNVDGGSTDRFNELVLVSKKYLSDSDSFLALLKEYMCEKNIPQDSEPKVKFCSFFLGNSTTVNKNQLENNKPNRNI